MAFATMSNGISTDIDWSQKALVTEKFAFVQNFLCDFLWAAHKQRAARACQRFMVAP